MESEDEQQEQVPLTKQKQQRTYEKTPAREECIKKMIEARKHNLEIKKQQRILETKARLAKEEQEQVQLKQDQPPKKQKAPRQIIQEESESEEEEPIVIIRKKPKKKKQPKIIIEEESESEEEEQQIIKKKKTTAPAPEKKTSVLKVTQDKPTAQPDKPIDYRSFFA